EIGGWQTGRGVLLHELAEQRSDSRTRSGGARGGPAGRSGLDSPALAVGVRRLVKGVKRTQDALGEGVDQIDRPQVPARVAHVPRFDVAIARGDLEAAALEADRSIRAALAASRLGAEDSPQMLARRTRTAHIRTRDPARDRRAADLRVDLAVVVELDPGLG